MKRFGLFAQGALLSGLFLSAPACSVYDSRENCPQGIRVEAYSKSNCDVDTLYPEAITDLRYYLFDEQNRLVTATDDKGVKLRSNYTHTIETASHGIYTVVACSNLDEALFEMPSSGKAIQTKEDLMFRLRGQDGRAMSLHGKRIYYGESPAVYLPDPAEYGSVYKTTGVNLQEQTNRITITVEGLARAQAYEVSIQSVGTSLSYEGKVKEGDLLEYPAASHTVRDGVLESMFTTLTLTTGFQTMLVIRDSRTRAEVYRGDLLGTLLLKNPEVNLDCDHDFNIRFTAADQCDCGTYVMMEIWVNNWLVHSYATDL
ncbi:MAG: FimB/Mfa2 family fimbrial subunit [Mediterranea sp.]|jgi:hypothetical protein|nr:FimB/Mfa2 family fimbrial subunit [Mediterranea sp.]